MFKGCKCIGCIICISIIKQGDKNVLGVRSQRFFVSKTEGKNAPIFQVSTKITQSRVIKIIKIKRTRMYDMSRCGIVTPIQYIQLLSKVCLSILQSIQSTIDSLRTMAALLYYFLSASPDTEERVQ